MEIEAALSMLPYVSEKINKDSLITHLDKLTLNIGSLCLQFEDRLTKMSERRSEPENLEIEQINKLISSCHALEHALKKARTELAGTPTTTLEKAAEAIEGGDASVRAFCCFNIPQVFGRYACFSPKSPEEKASGAGMGAADRV